MSGAKPRGLGERGPGARGSGAQRLVLPGDKLSPQPIARAEWQAFCDRVRDLRLEGRTSAQTARALDTSLRWVDAALARMRRAGTLPPWQRPARDAVETLPCDERAIETLTKATLGHVYDAEAAHGTRPFAAREIASRPSRGTVSVIPSAPLVRVAAALITEGLRS